MVLLKPLDKKYFKDRREHDVEILLQMSSIRTIQILQQLELNRPKDESDEIAEGYSHLYDFDFTYDNEESEDLEDSGDNIYYDE